MVGSTLLRSLSRVEEVKRVFCDDCQYYSCERSKHLYTMYGIFIRSAVTKTFPCTAVEVLWMRVPGLEVGVI